MKKSKFAGCLALVAVAALLTLGACQKEENTSDTPGGELKTLRIEVENQGGDGSKMETEGLQVHWSTGDQVGIKNRTYPVIISGGNAGVRNVPVNSVAYQGYNGCRQAQGTMKVFNAYYPPGIANYGDEYANIIHPEDNDNYYYLWNTFQNTGVKPMLKITLPSRYESGFAGGRQRIQLPMIGTYFYCPDARREVPATSPVPLVSNEWKYFTMGREVLRFQHLTAALLVKVRNDSGEPLLLDRVAVTSNNFKLSGATDARFEPYIPTGNEPEPNDPTFYTFYSSIYRKVSVGPIAAATDDEKQVEVVFPEPVVVAPGDTLPVQVPILPINYDNLTVRVEGRNESAPGVVGSRRLTFQHTVGIPEGIARNTMKTLQIKMDPASERVTVSAPSFSVDGYNKVLFSKGNLQYDTSTFTWSFMEHQWSTVETHGQNVGENYATQPIVSLFGWGTSGHDYGPDNYQPRSTSTTGTYGPGSSVLSATEHSDWGCNAIANGGNSENSGWFTLSRAQWAYLLGDTPERSGRHTLATVNNVPGLLLLPDDWDLTGFSFQASYSDAEWAGMEADGAVFLPAAGTRNGTSVNPYPSTYWTNDPNGTYSAHALYMLPNTVYLNSDVRERGCAVRLVRYAQ